MSCIRNYALIAFDFNHILLLQMTTHISSTQSIPSVDQVPQHIAIIMDGNGRWATKRFMPRVAGHKKGVEAVRNVVEACAKRGVSYLTLFAFSSENWRRPDDEVSLLMRLFLMALQREVGSFIVTVSV